MYCSAFGFRISGLRQIGVVVAAGFALIAATGCGGVNRRFVITSNVPNALVYIDEQPIGKAPAHAPFEYYGYYNIQVMHPGYHRKLERVHVVAPWYAYPPFDLLAVLWPFKVEDVRRYNILLEPARLTDTGELITNAEKLRERGMALPPPPHPATDRQALPPAAPVPPDPTGGTLPPPAPLPPPTPIPTPPTVIPNVGPSGSS